MKKYILAILVNISFLAPQLIAMEDPYRERGDFPQSPRHEALNFQDIMVVEKRDPNNLKRSHMLLARQEDRRILREYELPLHSFQEVWINCGQTLFVRGLNKHGQMAIVQVNEDGISPALTYDLKMIEGMQVAPNGSLFVKGEDQDGAVTVIHADGDEISDFTEYSFSVVHGMQVSPDGALYLWGQGKKGKATIQVLENNEISKGTISRLRRIYDIAFSSDGTLFMRGINQHNQVGIVQVKENKISKSHRYGLKFIYKMQVTASGTLFLWGLDQQKKEVKEGQGVKEVKKSKKGEEVILQVADDEILPLPTNNLKVIYGMQVAPDNSLFVWGQGQHNLGVLMQVKRDQVLFPLTYDFRRIYEVTFSPGGALLVRGQNLQEKKVIVWAKGDRIERYDGHNAFIVKTFLPFLTINN